MLLKSCAGLHITQAPYRPTHARKHPQAPRGFKNVEPITVTSPTASGPYIALKEWAALVAAIGDGEQIILLRKGGIREGPFKAPASSFYLFPTSFHSEGRLLKPDAETAYQRVMLWQPLSHSVLAFAALVGKVLYSRTITTLVLSQPNVRPSAYAGAVL